MLCPGVFDDHVGVIHQALAGVPHSAVAHACKLAVLGHRYAAVIEKISVAAQICAADAVDEIHVAVQRPAVSEKVNVFVYEVYLIVIEAVRIIAVDRRPLVCIEGVHTVVEDDGVIFKVAALEHKARIHPVAGVAQDDSALELEAQGVERDADVFLRRLAVVFAREIIQRLERYTIAPLEKIRVSVIERYPEHCEDARGTSGGRPQPENIVVAPLNVDIRVLHKSVEQSRRLGAAIEYIADDVQLIDGKALYDIRKRRYNVVSGTGGYDRLQNSVVIAHLI